MEKVADRFIEWLPLGMGEARRNFISGVISIATAWLLLVPGSTKHKFVDLTDWILLQIDKNSIVIFLFGLLIIILGKVVEFSGSLFPIVYNFLSDSDLRKSSKFNIFGISLYRCLQRQEKTDIKARWKHASIAVKRMNKIENYRTKRLKRECFALELTDCARNQFRKFPLIVKDGLVNPFGWNFEISINFLSSQSLSKNSLWILRQENQRKFVYMILCSFSVPTFVLILYLFSNLVIVFINNLEIMKANIIDIFENGFPDMGKEKILRAELIIPEEIQVQFAVVITSIISAILLFFSYVKYIKARCIQYTEAFTVSRHMERQETEEPDENSVTSNSLAEHIPQIGAREINR